MKTRTHLHAGQSTLYRFKAYLPGTTEPVRLLAHCHMDAVAQIMLSHAPESPWELELWIQGSRVGEWALEPAQSEPRPWHSSLSPQVHASIERTIT